MQASFAHFTALRTVFNVVDAKLIDVRNRTNCRTDSERKISIHNEQTPTGVCLFGLSDCCWSCRCCPTAVGLLSVLSVLSDGCRTAVGAVEAVGLLSEVRERPHRGITVGHCRTAVGLSMSDCWCCWTAVGAVVSVLSSMTGTQTNLTVFSFCICLYSKIPDRQPDTSWRCTGRLT